MSEELGYRTASGLYYNSGWKGVLPLPKGQKTPPPDKTTGYKGKWPEWEDIKAWGEANPNGNLALRLPNTVVGIDVDCYGNKKGRECLSEAESRFGVLPPGPKSTSRLDGISGIRLFGIPAGVELQTVVKFSEMGLDGIEVIQYFHRYCVAWPSVHPDTDRVYRWLDADWNVMSTVPHSGSLPALPQGWIDGLRRTNAQQTTVEADVDKILSELPDGSMSYKVWNRLDKALLEIHHSSGGRHDIALQGALGLFRLAEKGETGVRSALELLGKAFIQEIVADGSRNPDEAQEEWDRIVWGKRGHALIQETPSLERMLGNQPAKVESVQKPGGNTAESQRAQFNEMLGADDKSFNLAEQELDEFDRLLMGTTEEEGSTESRTSWSAIDLDPILDGDLTPEEPAVLERDDGKPILYSGRINAMVGESESGKSWLALLSCVEQINRGRGVVFLDFEDTPHNVVARLLALGLTREALRQHFRYVGPDTPMGPVEKEELFALLDRARPAVVVLDGVNAAMSLIGLDLEKNQEATQFHQWILKPVALTGATLIIVDHVTKSTETRGKYAIGAQAKRAMIDGVMLGVSAVEQFGRGRLGKLEVVVLKDKPGGVRAIAQKRGRAGVDYLCSAVIDARVEGKVDMRLIFEEKSPDGEEQEKKPVAQRNREAKMEQVSKFMETHNTDSFIACQPTGFSQNTIVRGVQGTDSNVLEALLRLVDTRHVSLEEGSGKLKLYRLLTPYRALAENGQVETLMGR